MATNFRNVISVSVHGCVPGGNRFPAGSRLRSHPHPDTPARADYTANRCASRAFTVSQSAPSYRYPLLLAAKAEGSSAEDES